MSDTLKYIVFGTDDPSRVAILGNDNSFTGNNTYTETTTFGDETNKTTFESDGTMQSYGTAKCIIKPDAVAHHIVPWKCLYVWSFVPVC